MTQHERSGRLPAEGSSVDATRFVADADASFDSARPIANKHDERAVPPSSDVSLEAASAPRRDIARLVRGLHDRCGRQVGRALGELLRQSIDIRLHDVEFVEYRQFILDVESPTCLAVFRVEPLDVPVALDLRPTLLFAMLNCLLGGQPRNEDAPTRPLTDIEQRLAARLVRVWTHELRSAWRDVAPLEPLFDRWEAHPHRAALAPLREPFMVTRFRAVLGGIDEVVTLAIPRRAIDELPQRLALRDDPRHASVSPHLAPAPLTEGPNPTWCEVCLDDVTIAGADLRSLRVGDVIATSHRADAPLGVRIGGVLQYLASPGVVQGRRAVRIEQPCDDHAAGVSPAVGAAARAAGENQR